MGLENVTLLTETKVERLITSPSGREITGVEGDFEAGDVVELIDGQGVVVARGMVGFDAVELPVEGELGAVG